MLGGYTVSVSVTVGAGSVTVTVLAGPVSVTVFVTVGCPLLLGPPGGPPAVTVTIDPGRVTQTVPWAERTDPGLVTVRPGRAMTAG
jgi:hypothetical protein